MDVIKKSRYNDCTMEPVNYWRLFRESATLLLKENLSEEQLTMFKELYTLVTEANRVMNLTAIRSLEDFLNLHLIDSLTLVPFLKEFKPDFSLIDIGSGAGFPALPLAIVSPQARIVAVESVGKKAGFIQKAASALNLNNIEVINERSETLAHNPDYRGKFDLVTARAVSSLNVLVEICLPFVKTGGRFLAMKSRASSADELKHAQRAISLMGGKYLETKDVSIPPMLSNRAVIIIEKAQKSPSQYPRKAGIPQKKPL